MIPDYFSYSSLQSYLKCPAQFQFRYVKKIFKKEEGVEAFMGKRVHETIEYIYNHKKENKILSIDQILNYFFMIWQKKWHSKIAIVNKRILPVDQERNIELWEKYAAFYFRTGENCLTKFYKLNHPFNQNEYSSEYKIDFLLDQDKNYRMKGVIDRLDCDINGNWFIHDYKTGKRVFKQSEADNDMQLGLYQIGLQQKMKFINSVTLVWHFLQQRQENIMIYSTRTKSDLNKLIIKIKNIIDEIKLQLDRNKVMKPRKTYLCNWCYYWKECPIQNTDNPYLKI